MGLVLHKKCNLNATIMSHQKGVSIKPDYFEAFNNMGNVFEDNDNLEHFHFMLVHSLRLRGSSSIGLG